jgi:hypothetical protein
MREIAKLATGETLRITKLEEVGMPDILVVRSSELLIRQDDNNGSRQRRDGVVRRRVQVADKENGECLTVQQCNPLPCLRS